jgi:hypothetical protein
VLTGYLPAEPLTVRLVGFTGGTCRALVTQDVMLAQSLVATGELRASLYASAQPFFVMWLVLCVWVEHAFTWADKDYKIGPGLGCKPAVAVHECMVLVNSSTELKVIVSCRRPLAVKCHLRLGPLTRRVFYCTVPLILGAMPSWACNSTLVW